MHVNQESGDVPYFAEATRLLYGFYTGEYTYGRSGDTPACASKKNITVVLLMSQNRHWRNRIEKKRRKEKRRRLRSEVVAMAPKSCLSGHMVLLY